MCLQIDGPVAKIQLEHGCQMEETSIYLFRGQEADRMKAVYFDALKGVPLFLRKPGLN